MPRLRRLAPLLVCAALPAAAATTVTDWPGRTLRICDDGSEWPPYTYFGRVDGKPTATLRGFAVDVIDAILKPAGIGYTIELIPWARCLHELEQGTSYQLALNASWSEERARRYLLTRPYYRTVNYAFHSRRQHPQGLAIRGVDDLKRHRVCGIAGYNYTTYGFAPGSIDQGARDFGALITKLHAGRCDLFVEKYEVLAGFGAIGQPWLDDPQLGRAPIPGMAPTPFYMLVSRRAPQADALLALIDGGLARLEASGQLAQLLKKHLP